MTGDLFAAYGADKGRRDTIRDWDSQRAKHSPVKELSPLEKKLREKQRLSKAYRIWRRKEVRAILASEPRLSSFLRYLRRVTVDMADELIDAITVCEWLLHAPQPVRLFALRMIDNRCNRLNQQLGNDTLDDPLPPETSTYFRARELLHPGGKA